MTMVQARAGPLQVVVADLGPVPEPPRLADRLDGHLLAAGAARQDRQEGEDGHPDDSGPSGRDGHGPIVVDLPRPRTIPDRRRSPNPPRPEPDQRRGSRARKAA